MVHNLLPRAMSEVTLQSIWEAIQQTKVEMTTHLDFKIGTVEAGLTNIQESLSSINEQISELQYRVSANEDNVDDLVQRVKALEKDNAHLRERVEDAENQSRRSNLRFINIPQKKGEVRDLTGFVKQLIPQLFGKENFPTAPVVERAHRSPATFNSNKPGSPRSSPILAKFLYFQDKVKILRLAREKGDLSYEGVTVQIYPDYSPGLVKKRREFDAVKKSLRAADIQYSLLYPSMLRVMVEGKPKLFVPKKPRHFFGTLYPHLHLLWANYVSRYS